MITSGLDQWIRSEERENGIPMASRSNVGLTMMSLI